MMGKLTQLEPKLFYHNISLEQRVPQDHPLRAIARQVDFSFVRSQVANLYGTRGHESVDPVVILKLMFLLFYENLKSERALMAQLPLRLDWLWFCGYDLDDKTPDHSVLSKARRRWGQDVFTDFFQRILTQCIDAGLVNGEVIHVDSSMIDANASKDTLHCQLRVVGQTLYETLEAHAEPQQPPLEKRVSTTDADARLGKKYGTATLGYKDHRAVDDQEGIITATVTTPANVNDEKVLSAVVEEHQANTDTQVKTAVADKAYGTGENYEYLHEQGITPCISHQRYRNNQDPDFTSDKFVYDKTTDRYRCPGGFTLTRQQVKTTEGCVVYRMDRQTCEQCPHFDKCVTSRQLGRRVQRSEYADYYEWADNCLSRSQRRRLMARRKVKAEGSFADAANNHGFKRARWRGLTNVHIQNLVIAAIQNLRKLMRHVTLKPARTGSFLASAVRFLTHASAFGRVLSPTLLLKPNGERIFTF